MPESHPSSDDFSEYHAYWRNRDEDDGSNAGRHREKDDTAEEDSTDHGSTEEHPRQDTPRDPPRDEPGELPRGGGRGARRPGGRRRKAPATDPTVALLHGLIGAGIDLAQKLEDGEHPWREARERGARAVQEDREARQGLDDGSAHDEPKDEISELVKKFDPSRFGIGRFGPGTLSGLGGGAGIGGGLVNDVLREASGAAEDFLDRLRNPEVDRDDWYVDDIVVEEEDPDDDDQPDTESGK